MSPMLVTIIPFDYGFFCHQNWRKFRGITKIGDNFVENQCRLLYGFEHTTNSDGNIDGRNLKLPSLPS